MNGRERVERFLDRLFHLPPWGRRRSYEAALAFVSVLVVVGAVEQDVVLALTALLSPVLGQARANVQD